MYANYFQPAAGGFVPLQAPAHYPAPPASAHMYASPALPPMTAPIGYQPAGWTSILAPIAKKAAEETVRWAAPKVAKEAKRWGKKLFGFQAHPYAPVQYAEIDVEIDEQGNEIQPMSQQIVPMGGPIGDAIHRWAPIVADGVRVVGDIAQYSPWSMQPGYPQHAPAHQPFAYAYA